MSNYDDPRFLRQTIDDLERRLKKLEGSALKMAANQQGALPGTMRAVTIGDPGQGSSMWLNLSGNLPGQAPYQAVTDANKVVRAEIGNLAANGNSPAMMGFRANDASGTPIFDSLGLIGAAKLLVSETPAPSTTSGSGTGWGTVQTIPGSGANFTLARTGNILVLSVCSVATTAGATNYTGMYHGIWTQAGAFVTRQQIGAAQFTQNLNYYIVGASVFTGLTGGTYQLREEFALDAATTSVTFGTGATGVGPRASVIQLGG